MALYQFGGIYVNILSFIKGFLLLSVLISLSALRLSLAAQLEVLFHT